MDMNEKVFLKDRGVVSETQCDLGKPFSVIQIPTNMKISQRDQSQQSGSWSSCSFVSISMIDVCVTQN